MPALGRRALHRAARGVARRMSPDLRRAAMSLAARAVDGPAPLPGPPPGPVLCVAPHPDDETIGCGGALALHARAGDDVRVLVATSGEATAGGGTDVAAAREAECRAACAALGLEPPTFARLGDGRLAEATADLADLLRELGDDAAVVYAPSVLDAHRDHRAANVALAAAGLSAEILGYEVWSPAPVDVVLDISSVIDVKETALRCYPVALESVDYVRAARGLAAYRSVGGGMAGQGFAEGFVRLDAPAHAAAVREARLSGS